jgi:hypothetical protein
VPRLADDLEYLLAVAAATLNADGTLIEANAGFRRILKMEGQERSAHRFRVFFYSRRLRL